MTNALAFDTHDAANRFKAAGFTADQVEALVDVTRRTTALPDVSTLATKADLTGEVGILRSELKTEIAGVELEIADLRSELRTEIAGVKTMIASTQVPTVTVILAAMAAMLVLSRSIPGAIH